MGFWEIWMHVFTPDIFSTRNGEVGAEQVNLYSKILLLFSRHSLGCVHVCTYFHGRVGKVYQKKAAVCPSRRRLWSRPQSHGPSTGTEGLERLQQRRTHPHSLLSRCTPRAHHCCRHKLAHEGSVRTFGPSSSWSVQYLSILPVDQSRDRTSRSAPTSVLLRVCRLRWPSCWKHTWTHKRTHAPSDPTPSHRTLPQSVQLQLARGGRHPQHGPSGQGHVAPEGAEQWTHRKRATAADAARHSPFQIQNCCSVHALQLSQRGADRSIPAKLKQVQAASSVGGRILVSFLQHKVRNDQQKICCLRTTNANPGWPSSLVAFQYLPSLNI